ncbi:MAG: dUTP diphosphatase [Spirochaetes bacterium]|nr:dUTP diphosphatase [Spirochaetota bacterium]
MQKKINIKIRLLPGAKIPEYKSDGSAGADLFAYTKEPIALAPGKTCLVPTGIFIELPPGFEAQIRPRSGLALEHGITLLNSPGTIDSDYRGEIKLIVTNFGTKEFIIENGMRIAQMVISQIWHADFFSVNELSRSSRNEGGFGHTGLS